MAERDYYDVIGVARDATPDQIKKAYRGLARKHHPDVNPGDKASEAKFKELQEAYDVLSDPEKRSVYDRYGVAGVHAAGARPGAEWTAPRQPPPGEGETFDFSEFFGPGGFHVGGMPQSEPTASGGGLFDEILGRIRTGRGGRKHAAQPRAARDTLADLRIPFLTAVQGGKTTIEVPREDGGREVLDVKVPPGTDTGSRLRLRGQGAEAPNGVRGDLTIQITVEPHPLFKRDGRDLAIEVPISVAEAILGARVDVLTLAGTRTMTIPAGTSTGQRLRLKGQGVPAHGNHAAGDLFVLPRIVVPKDVDAESRKLITDFAARNPSDPRFGLW